MRSVRVFFLLLAIPMLVLLTPPPAWAHVDLESTVPAAENRVEGPLDAIDLVFTEAALPADGGIEVVDGSGLLRSPDSVDSEDSIAWRVTFDPPLAAGTVAVRWTMRAGDAHPRSGSYTFELADPISASPPGQGPGEAPTSEPEAAESSAGAQDPVDLDEFLLVSEVGGAAARLASLGRVVSLIGVLLGVGGLAFTATVLFGTPGDIQRAVFWIRRFGVLAAVGAVVELAGQVVVDDSGRWISAVNPFAYGRTVATGVGLAVVLRLVGGLMLAASSRVVSKAATEASDVVSVLAELIPVGASAHQGSDGVLPPPSDGTAVRLNRTESLWAFVAAMTMIFSFSFDGHTVTAGPRLMTAMVDAVHVGGAAVWAGGVAMLALTAAYRARRGFPANLLILSARFSVIASLAVVAVGAAGLVLTWLVLDSPSELWSTPWGRIVLLKVLLVAIAGVFGLRNHRTLIPNYFRNPDSRRAHADLKRAVTIETAILVSVIAVTALLVVASSA